MSTGSRVERFVRDTRGRQSSPSIEVRTEAPFSVGAVLWRGEDGGVVATIAAKATYRLEQDLCPLLDTPEPIQEVDDHWEGDVENGLRVPSDLALFKSAPEVVLSGHAYAAHDRPVHEIRGRFTVGSVDKTFVATTARGFDGGRMQEGPALARFSLRYEVGPGGPGTDNPVGIDASDIDPRGTYWLPQLLPADFEAKSGVRVPPIGLGPIAPSWPSRAKCLRREDHVWLADPLARKRPRGFDARYFSVAPSDQQAAHPFRADERLRLEGLHPAHARLDTVLPGVTPRLLGIGVRRAMPPLVADTLFIDTDRQIMTLTFRASVALTDATLVIDLVASGIGEDTNVSGVGSERIGEGTAELVRGSLNIAAMGAPPSVSGLPFTPSVSLGRPPLPTRSSDYALPFSMAEEPTASLDAPPPTPPPLAPPSPPSASRPVAPPLVLVPPAKVPDIVPPPAAAPPPPAPVSVPSRATVGQQQAHSRAAGIPMPGAPAHTALGSPAPLEREPPPRGATPGPKDMPRSDAPRPEDRSRSPDPFRTAFGNATRTVGGESSASRSDGERGAPTLSAKAASDAAAADARSARTSTDTGREREAAGPVVRRALVDLICFAPDLPRRLRRSKRHSAILSDFHPPRPPGRIEQSEVTPDADRQERGRLEVLRVLSCGTPVDATELHDVSETSLEDSNDLEMPIALVEGTLKVTFDELEALRIAASIAKPLAVSDKRLQAALAVANDALAATMPPATETLVTMYRQIEVGTRELSLPPRYLVELVERTLLEKRGFKRRTLLGAPRIRAELTLPQSSAIPIYLPDAASAQLPLLPSFPVIALVELRPREDAQEPQTESLLALALGRIVRGRTK